MEKQKYYITTAIAYTSGKPHIGNTYEVVLADAIARYKHSILKKKSNLRLSQRRLSCRCDHSDRRKISNKHRQNMLQSKRNRFRNRYPPIQLVNVADTAFFVLQENLLSEQSSLIRYPIVRTVLSLSLSVIFFRIERI